MLLTVQMQRFAGRVCVRERERQGHITVESAVLIAACVQTHTSFISVSCHMTLSPSPAWIDGKTKDIINCLYIYFESWSSQLWKGAFPSSACEAWCFRDVSRDAKGLGTSSKLRCYVGLLIVTLSKNLIKYENRYSQIFNIGYRELHATYMDFFLFCF